MKVNKLMVAVAAMALAFSASATTLKWGLGAGEYLDDVKIDVGTMYLCQYTGTVDWSVLANQSTYTEATISEVLGMKVLDHFGYSKEGDSISASTFLTPTDVGTTAGKFYYICIDDGAKDIAYTATVTAQSINTSPTGATKTKTASAFSYETASGSVIPEPTSALMLLVGLAGLALKRKVA